MTRSIFCAASAAAMVTTGAHAQELNDNQMRQLAAFHYTCAIAMAYATEFGNKLAISEDEAFGGFDAVIKTGRVKEGSVVFNVNEDLAADHGYVPEAEPDDQPESFVTFAWRHADQCVDDYKRIRLSETGRSAAEQPPAQASTQVGSSEATQGQEITVAYLRDHYRQNRDARLIVDYITGRHPSGKRLMGDPVPEMEFLGELINAVPDQGMRSLSDAALLAMVNKQYWQYNPPASRKVMAEYQRRLRVQRYNDREAKLWADRVERERRQELATMANRMAERWGTSIKCTNVAPQGATGRSYTSCRMLDSFGQ
ncbi:hypothetical protein QWY75_08515 [Pontixanthobacter aestiaquae]|uniref:Uncharacterized protein n=1 Tax=Pontixanthobacter aestiaquae TaxID=1509367 RepID=A0A844Z696_9SPHN|nr:hypothetical protein [Pontixanthobacter aestiaquae]MDN3646242.1 hypothetical protein [Pontixanthobacter aestiaquae]MXO82766.1 hypothetical protein [Pontixanthobacter aestiaquae]